MKRFSEQLQKKSNSLKLKVSEKRDLRERLVSYMEYHPLSNELKAKQTQPKSATQGAIVQIFHTSNKWKFLQWSGVTAVLLLMVVPFVAEKSVPGDTLYAVKVNLNEEVRGTLARSSYEKVVWETERLNRRIAEARLLASEGKMTDEIEESVAEAVRVHNENARKEIENIKQIDEEEAILASIQLDTTLDIQSTSLKNSQRASTSADSTDKIVDVLAKSHSPEVTTGENILPSYERLIGRIESETTRAYELLNSVKQNATKEEQVDIKRRLEDIERKTKTAIEKGLTEDKQSNLDARGNLVDALQQTQGLIVFMTNIDVRETVTVDEIVPVTPTPEEEVTNIEGQIKQGEGYIDSLEKGVKSTTTLSVAVKEKANLALKENKPKLASLKQQFASGNFDPKKLEVELDETVSLLKSAWEVLEKETEAVLEELDKLDGDKSTTTSTSTEGVLENKSTSTVDVSVDKASSSEAEV